MLLSCFEHFCVGRVGLSRCLALLPLEAMDTGKAYEMTIIDANQDHLAFAQILNHVLVD